MNFEFEGIWMSPGHVCRWMRGFADSSIIFSELEPTEDRRAHGFHRMLEYENDVRVLFLAFHCYARNDALASKTMYEVSPNLWQTVDKMEMMWIYRADFGTAMIPVPPPCAAFFPRVKHLLRWFHPGRDIQYVLCLQDGSVVWSDGNCNCRPHGEFSYVSIPGNGAFLYFRFHWSGNLDFKDMPVTLLQQVQVPAGGRRDAGNNPGSIWRAVGTVDFDLNDQLSRRCRIAENAKELQKWHIVAHMMF